MLSYARLANDKLFIVSSSPFVILASIIPRKGGLVQCFLRTKSGKRGKRWLFDIIDADTRFLLATHLSSTRTTKDAQRLVEMAAAKAGKIPKVIITDKLAGYIDGIELAFGADTKHIQSKPFTNIDSTNLIERFHGTLKDRTKVMRGMKQPLPEILDGWVIYYNYFRPHESLRDRTPAEAADIKFPFRNWLDVVKSQSPVVERQEQEKEGFTFAPVKNYRKRVYRGKRRTTVNRFGNEPKLTVGIVSTRR